MRNRGVIVLFQIQISTFQRTILLIRMATNSQRYSHDDASDKENIGRKFVSCNVIRKKITLFLATKEMTQTAFLSAIGGVNSNSFNRFMKLKEAYGGIDNGTYEGARKFFDRRTKKRTVDATSKMIARDIELPEDLPVFDDCDEVRTKIGQCFHKKEFSQAAFAGANGLTAGLSFCCLLKITNLK